MNLSIFHRLGRKCFFLLPILALFLFCSSAHAVTPTMVQPVTCPQTLGAANPVPWDYVCSLAEPSQVHNRLILGVFNDDTGGTTTVTVSDDKGNTWTRLVTLSSTHGNAIRIFTVKDSIAGTHKITVHFATAGSGGFIQGSGAELYNVDTATDLDGVIDGAGTACTNTDSTTTITSGNITIGTMGDLLFQFIGNEDSTVTTGLTAGSGQSNITWNLWGDVARDGSGGQYGVYNSTTTFNPTLTTGTSHNVSSCAVAFKSASAGNAPSQAFRIVQLEHYNLEVTDAQNFTFNLPAGTGDMIVLSHVSGAPSISSVTSTPSNTWNSTGAAVNDGSTSDIFYACNASVSTSMSVTVNRSATGDDTIWAYVFVGSKTGGSTACFDNDSGGQTGNQLSQPATLVTCTNCLTPSTASGVVIANYGQANCTAQPGPMNTPSGGWEDTSFSTSQSFDGPQHDDENNGDMHFYNSSASAVSLTWTIQGCGANLGLWAGRAAHFFAAPTGGASVPSITLLGAGLACITPFSLCGLIVMFCRRREKIHLLEHPRELVILDRKTFR